QRRGSQTATQALPVISDVFLNQGAQYENIVVPITDGTKTMQVVTNLQRAYKSECRELIDSIERYITLAIIDAGRLPLSAHRPPAPQRAEREHRAEGPAPHIQAGVVQVVRCHDRAHQQ
ncbi:MAG TPA: hypothetical protein P5291_08020, partial [Flavobacteriales bacterium]|nr:hypothetical protein [Flavobacteriales bacterium]